MATSSDITSVGETGTEFGETVHYEDSSVTVVNETEVDSESVMMALMAQSPEVAALTQWTRGQRSRRGSLIDRDRYVTPTQIWDQMRLAMHALEHDDVVSGVYETIEALAFGHLSIDVPDDDESDVWGQIIDDIDLESRIREMWREDFALSQVVVGQYYGTKSYKVQSKPPRSEKAPGKQQRARRKTFDNLKVPLGISILDQTKIVPVGNTLFNQDQMAYAASVPEVDQINAVLNGMEIEDPIVRQLIVREYQCDVVEQIQLGEMGLPTQRLFLMNPNRVFRHTQTRQQYRRFASLRMLPIFELLDLKEQQRQLDRSSLVGSTNYLLLVRRGSKEQPATPAEIADTNNKFRTMARVPVIVGDHRLDISIITPKNDNILDANRYDTIDTRIIIRLLSLFIANKQQGAARSDDSIKLARVIGRSLESRRHMLRRSIERYILKPIWEQNEQLKCKPTLRFHPQHIALDLDPALLTYLLDMSDRGLLSMETTLEQVDVDVEVEATRRELEDVEYKGIFTPRPGVPGAAAPEPDGGGSTAAPQNPKSGGRAGGGLHNGGGSPRRGRGPGPNANDDDGSP